MIIFFSSCSFTVFSNCSGGSIGGLPNFTPLAFAAAIPSAGEPSANVGKNFLRSYAGVCLQGVVIALACIIFSTIAVTDPAVDSSVSAVTAVWSYVGELVFNLLILVGAIKGCDRIVKEIMGL